MLRTFKRCPLVTLWFTWPGLWGNRASPSVRLLMAFWTRWTPTGWSRDRWTSAAATFVMLFEAKHCGQVNEPIAVNFVPRGEISGGGLCGPLSAQRIPSCCSGPFHLARQNDCQLYCLRAANCCMCFRTGLAPSIRASLPGLTLLLSPSRSHSSVCWTSQALQTSTAARPAVSTFVVLSTPGPLFRLSSFRLCATTALLHWCESFDAARNRGNASDATQELYTCKSYQDASSLAIQGPLWRQ